MHVLRTSSTVFQFTLPRGERHYKKAVARLEIEFQFTLPRGERPATALRVRFPTKFQFTLPRGERQTASGSTHLGCVFQFTLPRGERRPTSGRASWTLCFNSRSREGSDDLELTPGGPQLRVSIHAPARGATLFYTQTPDSILFQFTLPRGERLRTEDAVHRLRVFQFTLPRGERR